MEMFIKIIGIFFLLLSIVFIAKPGIIKLLIAFYSKGSRIYIAGIIRFILAVVFIAAARECRHSWIILLMGLLFLAGAVIIFAINNKSIKTILAWYQSRPMNFLRILAIVPLLIALLILYAA